MAYIKNEQDTPVVPHEEAKRFIIDTLMALGAPKDIADGQAQVMTEADIRGHFSHGMNRLEMYVQEIEEGDCDPKALPKVLNESDSTAWVDANNGMGCAIGFFCMNKAIEKAQKTGVGWVTCKNANHNGIEAFYALMAIRKGLLGMAFTNTSPLMTPTRTKGAALGTNPICAGAPGKGGDYFLLDIATSAVALGKIELEKKKGSKQIPEGWAADLEGQTTTDPDVALKAACLMPLGGTEENSGYKGTGLAMLVEIFCGITSGSMYGPYIKKWREPGKSADLGQCYIAMDPKCFAPGFEDRMSDLLDYIRNMPRANADRPVFVPGDFERGVTEKTMKQGGIRYNPTQLDICAGLASKLGIKPLLDITGQPVSGGGGGGAPGYVCKAACAKPR